MLEGVFVKKVGMTQKFRQNGEALAVTICQAEPFLVLNKKIKEKDGYQALVLGLGKKKQGKKPLLGFLKKKKIKCIPRLIREVKVKEDIQDIEIGKEIDTTNFLKQGQLVNVTGFTKGRGFAGVIKRWGFHRQPKTHGQSDRERAPGSIGAQTPGRVIKGKKMPGRLGNEKRTIKNVEVVFVDREKKEILLKGAVPGRRGDWIFLSFVGEVKNYIPVME